MEIIKRVEGQKAERSVITGRPQVSYNSDGHLCLRMVQSNDEDTLIVFDFDITGEILGFADLINHGRRRSQPKLVFPDDDDVPF